MPYRLTDQGRDEVRNAKSISAIKGLARVAVSRMFSKSKPDRLKAIAVIDGWTGTHTTIRNGDVFITIEEIRNG